MNRAKRDAYSEKVVGCIRSNKWTVDWLQDLGSGIDPVPSQDSPGLFDLDLGSGITLRFGSLCTRTDIVT